ncbi:MG2 domain-containing protein [Mucilaginibacter terrae]|uniref:Macroglobulin domain-containing protein n=1 Tax=Mucilaginibacter terrae TaxID=1955052 RepID=A0ABU3GX48_9SPHI|nr:MG2 domain-containing protein [Mucilaginibacter terrae]MDT3403567.1 hypothetical protein [Mucilaginibacter terrae]
MKRALLFFSLISWCCFNLLAQTAPANTAIKLYFEKAYLHTDRDDYAAGDDIWFKAYLVNAQTNKLISTSNNLYVELIRAPGVLVDKRLIRLDNGTGNGDFKLSAAASAGTYTLRAYTNWMRNFDDKFFFEKHLRIYNDTLPLNSLVKSTLKKDSKAPNSVSVVVNEEKPAIRLSFFPEGGSMIENTEGIIAFKAENEQGKGLPVKGGIYTSTGNKVTDFESNANGLGCVALKPLTGTMYEARGTYGNGRSFTSALPQSHLQGVAMHASKADTLLKILFITNAITLNTILKDTLLLVARSKGKLVFKRPVTLPQLQTQVNISQQVLPAGITAITLYDAQNRPLCERLIFNEQEPKETLTLIADKLTYSYKEKTGLTLKITDIEGKPVIASLSMAAVDAMVPKQQGNMISYLGLQSEIRGNIEGINQYFNSKGKPDLQKIDLLLLTQGWRDFLWKRMADSTIRIKYAPEQGIDVYGRTRRIWVNKPVPGLNVTLFANGAKGNKLYTTTTDSVGRYAFYNLNLTGNQPISLSATNNKGKQEAYLLVDTVTHSGAPVKPIPLFHDSTKTVTGKLKNELLDRSRFAARQRLTDTIQLNDVVVSKTPLRQVLIDTIIKMARADYSLKTLRDYILERVPGAVSGYQVAYFYGLNHLLMKVPMLPRFSVDGVPFWQVRNVFFYDIPLEQIEEIRFRKFNLAGAPTIAQDEMRFRRGENFWIQLKLKPHALDNINLHTAHLEVEGYDEARAFYKPTYDNINATKQADVRTTLHWEPIITTNINGEATVIFYNKANWGNVRVVVEGITNTGTPLTGLLEYSVKQ